MKRPMILMVGLLVASVPGMGNQVEDEAAVRKAVEKLTATWNAKDLETYVALPYEISVPWAFSGKGTKAAQEKRTTASFARQKKAQFRLLDEIGIVFVTPDVAIYKATEEGYGLVDAEGKPQPSFKLLVAYVMAKRSGEWLLAAWFGRPAEE